MVLLKSNQILRGKYRGAVQNKFEVSGEVEEVDQQWVKFKYFGTHGKHDTSKK